MFISSSHWHLSWVGACIGGGLCSILSTLGYLDCTQQIAGHCSRGTEGEQELFMLLLVNFKNFPDCLNSIIVYQFLKTSTWNDTFFLFTFHLLNQMGGLTFGQGLPCSPNGRTRKYYPIIFLEEREADLFIEQ